jgi:hypothetical protein
MKDSHHQNTSAKTLAISVLSFEKHLKRWQLYMVIFLLSACAPGLQNYKQLATIWAKAVEADNATRLREATLTPAQTDSIALLYEEAYKEAERISNSPELREAQRKSSTLGNVLAIKALAAWRMSASRPELTGQIPALRTEALSMLENRKDAGREQALLLALPGLLVADQVAASLAKGELSSLESTKESLLKGAVEVIDVAQQQADSRLPVQHYLQAYKLGAYRSLFKAIDLAREKGEISAQAFGAENARALGMVRPEFERFQQMLGSDAPVVRQYRQLLGL